MTFSAAPLHDVWRCPKSRSPLLVSGDTVICLDPACRLSYPIQDGIPVMLIDQAQTLSADEWQAATRGPDASSAASSASV